MFKLDIKNIYKKIKLYKNTSRCTIMSTGVKSINDFYAFKSNIYYDLTHKKFKPYLKQNVLTLIKMLLFDVKINHIKNIIDMMHRQDNNYNFQKFDLLYRKLNDFYTILAKFILEITYIFYWDVFNVEKNFITKMEHSGIDIYTSLKLALEVGINIQQKFEYVINNYLNNLEKEIK